MSTIDNDEPLEVGAEVFAGGGRRGKLARVIVDPIRQVVTHIVVAPEHHSGLGKLVPIELVADAGSDRIELECTQAQFETLDDAEDVQFLPGDTDAIGYGSHSMSWPYFGIETSSGPGHSPMYTDRIPAGEVEVRRGDEVHASDGWVGSVHGLVIDPQDHHVTHVLLQEGHLWGRKQVAIPIGAASSVGNEVRVAMTQQEIQELPPVKLRQSGPS